MEFLNLVNAMALHVTSDNMDLASEFIEKLIVLGELMESASMKSAATIGSHSVQS